jgi:hypothetical protein
MPHSVVHFEILGKDQKLLETFYKDIFDWQITPVMEGYSMIKPGGGIDGGIGTTGPSCPSGSHVTFYVAVPDVSAALEQIESKGGKKAFGPSPIPDGLIAGFLDPEGHMIGLVQEK